MGGIAVLSLLLVLILMRSAAVAETSALFQRGEALFLGHEPLKDALMGKPRGHETFLAAEAVRCVNCHGGGQGALALHRDLLLVPRQRRGGPPSAYSESSFCKMLRTGIDPAYVMIDHEMPIYEMAAGDCAGLWAYLTERDEHDANR